MLLFLLNCRDCRHLDLEHLLEVFEKHFFCILTFINRLLHSFFKMPALKTLDPELIHVEIIHGDDGKCGKISSISL